MPRTWQDLTQEEFEFLAHSEQGQTLANLCHAVIYGPDEKHSMYHSCGCSHIAVDTLLEGEKNV